MKRKAGNSSTKRNQSTKLSRISPEKKIPVELIRHKDKRKVIPTQELRGFVKEDEEHPKIMLYPRDTSLDPQLVWKGKDEQDAADLAVPIVPIYIQEKIHPKVIIENVRSEAAKGRVESELDLFGDFNGIPFDKQVDFYQQDGNWQNRLILGDSLLTMTSLAEKEGLKGKVQMIYLDPPYGIKFGSNWQVSTRKRDVKDGKAEDAVRQPEQIRAFRDTWKFGVHSYLSYLRDRLVVSRELINETGSVFVQIGDQNVHLVKSLLDEVFGSENAVATIAFKKTAGLSKEEMSSVMDFVLWYAKEIDVLKSKRVFSTKDLEDDGAYVYAEKADGSRYRIKNQENLSSLKSEGSRLLRHQIFAAAGLTKSCVYPFRYGGKEFNPPTGTSWKTNEVGATTLARAGRLEISGRSLTYVRFAEDFPVNPINNFWTDTASGSGMDKQYVVQTSTKVIERCVMLSTDPGDLVLDPTCGSGTTAVVAEQWGRRWITIDTSRVALTLARTRLMAARYPYYLLADSPEGLMQEAKLTGKVPPVYKTDNDIKKGFVYERVPHVTLKSIANNPEIDGIHAKHQQTLESLRAELNKMAKGSWEEWEVPFTAEASWSDTLKAKHSTWLAKRRERQSEIDAAISRHADTELLYDKPYQDNKRVRVTGPFTVESLNPFRMVTTEDRPTSEKLAARDAEPQFFQMVLENLRKAGVQNTRKNERIKFESLTHHAGTWIQATGEYSSTDGKTMRAAISIGPEFNAVPPQQIREAAKEAVKGAGFDILLVCGYSFDPHVSQEVKDYGKLTVLTVRINEDLKMADELLKKTGSGNLFMVFGEPDIKMSTQEDGKITVEIKGLDVYDPTTGQIRSSSPDEIACWFIDDDYNGESFFVRQAYFTGANDPYDKLKRALRAEIDEAAWSMLYTTVSRPFDRPSTGKFAVKVINHYGDEVLKVYETKNQRKSGA